MIDMTFIEPGTTCTHPLVGMCRVKNYDENGRALVEYKSKSFSNHYITASIAPHFLEVVNNDLWNLLG